MAYLCSRWSLATASVVVVLAAVPAACGGTATAPTNDPRDAGGTDSGSSDGAAGDGATSSDGSAVDASNDGGIPLPAEGTSCVPGQLSCDRVDLCCASAAACDAVTKRWKLSGQECLLCQTHGCGDKTCQGTEMCVAQAPGAAGGQPTYGCAPYPAACAREWTCGCVEKNLPAGCTLAVNGCNDTDLPVKISCMGI